MLLALSAINVAVCHGALAGTSDTKLSTEAIDSSQNTEYKTVSQRRRRAMMFRGVKRKACATDSTHMVSDWIKYLSKTAHASKLNSYERRHWKKLTRAFIDALNNGGGLTIYSEEKNLWATCAFINTGYFGGVNGTHIRSCTTLKALGLSNPTDTPQDGVDYVPKAKIRVLRFMFKSPITVRQATEAITIDLNALTSVRYDQTCTYHPNNNVNCTHQT